MKILLALVISNLAFGLCALGFEKTAEVLERDKNFNLKVSTVTLKNLISNDSYEGLYFKIVEGKSNEAIKFNAGDLAIKAANVYHHLTKAREYFKTTPLAKKAETQGQLTIRIEMKNRFSDVGHFMHDDLAQEYNNALSIPKSGSSRLSHYDSWNYEIWFRPAKKVKGESGAIHAGHAVSNFEYKKMFYMTMTESSLLQVIQSWSLDSSGEYIDPQYHLQTLVTTIGVVELIPWTLKLYGKFFKPTHLLDTAMIPEIIYHEYAHVVMADHLPLVKSTPIVEGFANFYAGEIAGAGQLGTKAGRFSKGLSGKDADSKVNYSPDLEYDKHASSSFTFKFLRKLKSFSAKHDSDAYMYCLLEKMNESSNITHDLVDASFQCLKTMPNNLTMKLKLHNLVQELNL